jgi:flagellar L-ring protein precursor FlgH
MRNSTKILLVALTASLPQISFCQSLWHDATSRAMFADKRGAGVGDILTIVIQENTTATKSKETKTERSSSLTAAIASFLYPASAASGILMHNGQMPAMQYNSDHKHDGSGSINHSESILAHIAVKVVDVLPNKNLVIEGKRETSFSGERQTIVLHGIVRDADVASDNTVLSYNVADATIQIIGKGTVTDSQNKGWFNRLWDKVNPF